jgi:hypothetical protein
LDRAGVTNNILSSYYLRERFQPGDHLKLKDQESTLEAIGPFRSKVSIAEGLWIIPNKDLIEALVLPRERPPEDRCTGRPKDWFFASSPRPAPHP